MFARRPVARAGAANGLGHREHQGVKLAHLEGEPHRFVSVGGLFSIYRADPRSAALQSLNQHGTRLEESDRYRDLLIAVEQVARELGRAGDAQQAGLLTKTQVGRSTGGTAGASAGKTELAAAFASSNLQCCRSSRPQLRERYRTTLCLAAHPLGIGMEDSYDQATRLRMRTTNRADIERQDMIHRLVSIRSLIQI